MNKRDIFIGLGILGAFGLGAVLFILIIPHFFASEDRFPDVTPVVEAKTTASSIQVLPVTPTLAPSPTLSPATTVAASTVVVPTLTTAPVPPTLTPTAKPTSTVAITQASPVTPQITQQPYSLPKGIGPSDGARSCPQPLTVDKIRNDYLGYWDALKDAYKENNPGLLEPFVDITARDGKLWQGERDAILKTREGGYWLDYQIEHSSPLIVKINPYFGGPGECQVSVFDGTKLTVLAKKVGTDEPFNKENTKAQVQQYKPSHSFEMVVRNGRWVIAGEGAGEL